MLSSSRARRRIVRHPLMSVFVKGTAVWSGVPYSSASRSRRYPRATFFPRLSGAHSPDPSSTKWRSPYCAPSAFPSGCKKKHRACVSYAVSEGDVSRFASSSNGNRHPLGYNLKAEKTHNVPPSPLPLPFPRPCLARSACMSYKYICP